MTTPNLIEIANGCPTVTLAGQEWPIPLLAIKQNKIVVPAIIRLGRPGALTDLNEASFNDLITVAYNALNRAHPELTRGEFEDMPVSARELIASLDLIAQQTGVLVEGEVKKSGKKATA